MTSRTMPYLARKLKEDKSMALKRNGLKVCRIQFRESCAHDETGPIPSSEERHVEPKFDSVDGTPVVAYLIRRHHNARRYNSDVIIRQCRVRWQNAPCGERLVMNQLKNERAPVRTQRQTSVKVGWPTGRETYGHGAPIVVGGRESRLHGEGAGYESIRELHPDEV
jgi:hypothetical protein